MKKIEIITWHKCNCRCIFCASYAMKADKSLSIEEVASLLKTYRMQGADEVNFGGGEPTTREDLPAMAAVAKKLGYSRIGIKTNGMRICYPDYTKHLMESGFNEFYVSMWGHDPETHDALARREGAFEATEMGLKNLSDFGADFCVDFLITKKSVSHLAEIISKLANIGVPKFSLWLYSIFGSGGKYPELLPSLSEAGAAARDAFRLVHDRVESIKTSHIFPCFLHGCEEMYFNIKELELYIVSKNSGFWGEESPFEAGMTTAACERCRRRDVCTGPRPEYVDVYGDKEFSPIT